MMSFEMCPYCSQDSSVDEIKTCDGCGTKFCESCQPMRTDDIPADYCEDCVSPSRTLHRMRELHGLWNSYHKEEERLRSQESEATEFIELVLNETGVTQRVLAKMMGISDVWLCEIKSGRSAMPLHLVASLSNCRAILKNESDTVEGVVE